MAGIDASEEMAPEPSEIASIPATVIVSTRAWPGDGGIEGFALWQEQQAAFARGFRTRRLVPAQGAGHYVHREQPALVAREIEALVRAMSCKEESSLEARDPCA
jgi:pimeloyl-ACP methyl ester carboxylesterase